MQPEDWITIAENVFCELENYDGFVITHGTDTMAYTASALTFMLQDIKKPVVITGSQIPLREKNSDAEKNILDAFIVACENITGVFIVLIRGCRASKLRTKSFNAFESINYPYVGTIRNNQVEYAEKPSIPKEKNPRLNTKLSPDVFVLKLVPGTGPEIIEAIIKLNYKAVIIESFGAGGIPFQGRNFLPYVKKLLDKEICVAIATQCKYDGVDLSLYEIGQKTQKMGVVSAHDMTFESLVAKLMWALGQSDDINEINKIMVMNYAGEISALDVTTV